MRQYCLFFFHFLTTEMVQYHKFFMVPDSKMTWHSNYWKSRECKTSIIMTFWRTVKDTCSDCIYCTLLLFVGEAWSRYFCCGKNAFSMSTSKINSTTFTFYFQKQQRFSESLTDNLANKHFPTKYNNQEISAITKTENAQINSDE